ncbi:DEAD-box ATP-dependent RNA helicase FANCM [Cornus florida]|uniref:DEAD-box ATP-dependent RNA helicase FANCM n=1 Tax=Cornus florida TaxID=4283 RepID=UPI002898D9FE|nr:DEAD-box ATP-dependent RNA helicase FANCM [Cornus florida]
MASDIAPEMVVDDDEFDWEAAVREIDVACEKTKPSTSLPIEHPHQVFTKNKTQKKHGSSRQSTLDHLIGKAVPKPRVEKWDVRDRDQERIESDEIVSCINIDAEAAKTWIYPVNIPLRDYQLSITKTALFSNTLVALPTGLGKTLIAAVVMYNYFRWFPEGKIVFAAPSRPLVMQQIEACHNIVGIPQEWAIDLTGQTSPVRRAYFWKAKRVFFVTPQVLEKDIQSGTCLVKQLVCLVIDEAHRASGNYSYCVAVRELMAVPVQLRILALTATPGSKQQMIQHVIDNLQISTLEYRNESDHDVSPYVHGKKIELIEVAMGQDADEINNLLSEVIRPFVARLCAIGVLQNRDFQTLSPCDLLNSRDKFRQAPPLDLSHMKYGEVEGCFGVLITLYHIRKLLSSHGIRPAFEMLEEKLKQGSFARLMSRNEVIWKAKLSMQHSLSHGAPSPKLSKMLEVLIDHFKTKDPQNSRVIIFSNFRGSVRDIMDALAKIGEFVKATQFIGQSSGKTLKGQSQKVQQAVLEKFRAGGYNVIVATSIGEEGLDIMEVDLVISFDANISPLRMIQRMGRTGRKHDGRVVVLACEGSELKGYMRKQANSKSIKKHMRNGGMNSFIFHSSPRMVPHIFKPEVQFHEMSIEQFIPRGKKGKEDHPVQTPEFKAKLTDSETQLIAKYFHPTIGNTWRPSLIAFPHFQAFPSRVHNVMHSFRTGMLIDIMQRLEGFSFSSDSKASFVEDEASSDLCLRVEPVEPHHNTTRDLQNCNNSQEEEHSLRVASDSDVPMECTRTQEKHCMPSFQDQNPATHSYLFGSDFVSVDALGRVLVVSVPLLPLKEDSDSNCTTASSTALLNYLKENSFHLKASPGNCKENTMQVKAVCDPIASTHTICMEFENLPTSRFCNPGSQLEKLLDVTEGILVTPISKGNISNEGDSTGETPNVTVNKTPMLLADESDIDFGELELSPRLTSFIKSGVVPESPVHEAGISKNKGRSVFMVEDLVSPPKLDSELLLKSPMPIQNAKPVTDSSASGKDIPVSSVINEIQIPLINVKNSSPRGCIPAFPVEEIRTPSANLANNSCSKDWGLSYGNKSGSVQQEPKFKRLRKFADLGKRTPPEGKEENIVPAANLATSCASTSPGLLRRRGKKNLIKDARAFIEEEAEVSSEVAVSDDEEYEQDTSSFDDSFIDDRIYPTEASTQADASRSGMMAIYRRSLLSQSPIGILPSCFMDISPDTMAPKTRLSESGSSLGTTNHSLRTPETGLESASASIKFNVERISSGAMPCTTNGAPTENEKRTESRKRKLSFYQVGSVPAINLEQEFLSLPGAAGKESSVQGQAEHIEANGDVFDDDQFYEGIDLDAVEKQAASLLGYKSEFSMQKRTIITEPSPQNLGVLGSPTFDLGI